MKKVKIFLASSVDDLRDDRLFLGDFFRQLNEIYLDSGIHFSLIKCEDYDNAIAAGGKQSQYDREIQDSDLVFFLFFRKVGDYTKHELEVALEAFYSNAKPKIVTYFKYVTTIDEANEEVKVFMAALDREMKHYYNTYGHIDTLKLGILMQIKLMGLDDSEVKLQDGQVLLNGNQIARAENVPLLSGNTTLQALTGKKRQLQQQLSVCRAAYLEEPSEEKEVAFFDASAELNRVSRELTEIEKQTLQFMSTIAEITSDGKVLTYRQKEALKYIHRGDYDGAQAILDDEERRQELQRIENRRAVTANEARGYVQENLLWIQTERPRGVTEASAAKIREKYEEAIRLTQENDLEKDVFYDYASFLGSQNDHPKAISVAEKLQWYYSDPAAVPPDQKRAVLLNLLGNLYSATQRYQDAEQVYTDALEVFRRLAAHAPEVYEPELATTYHNLGILYWITRRYAQAQASHVKSAEIRQRLSSRNPERFAPALATSYNSIGVVCYNIHRYMEAQDAHCKALELRKQLSQRNPELYQPELLISYNNLGNLYFKTQRYAEAEEAYTTALEICQRLSNRNPEAYEPDLATGYNNLGILYSKIKRYDKAEVARTKALEIRQRLYRRNPEAYEPDLATSYHNLGNLYSDVQRVEVSAEMYRKALEIKRRLYERNPEAYAPALATTLWNLVVLYNACDNREKVRSVAAEALTVYRKMQEANPRMYHSEIETLQMLLQ